MPGLLLLRQVNRPASSYRTCGRGSSTLSAPRQAHLQPHRGTQVATMAVNVPAKKTPCSRLWATLIPECCTGPPRADGPWLRNLYLPSLVSVGCSHFRRHASARLCLRGPRGRASGAPRPGPRNRTGQPLLALNRERGNCDAVRALCSRVALLRAAEATTIRRRSASAPGHAEHAPLPP